jgi:hypothetical protein
MTNVFSAFMPLISGETVPETPGIDWKSIEVICWYPGLVAEFEHVTIWLQEHGSSRWVELQRSQDLPPASSNQPCQPAQSAASSDEDEPVHALPAGVGTGGAGVGAGVVGMQLLSSQDVHLQKSLELQTLAETFPPAWSASKQYPALQSHAIAFINVQSWQVPEHLLMLWQS